MLKCCCKLHADVHTLILVTLFVAVRVCGQEGSWFATSRGTRQGDPISPTVFIADLERAMDKVKDGKERISVHKIRINNLRFVDDINIIAVRRR